MNDSLSVARKLWEMVGIRNPIILASSSPRRAAILRSLGCPFTVVPPLAEERAYGSWDGGELLRRRAVQKARGVQSELPDSAVLAADTIVLLGSRVLGKPEDKNEAGEMLSLLSGKVHEVWTAVCYIPSGEAEAKTALSATRVTFRTLSSREIMAYIETGEPMDKAGAYGIQGIGGLWVLSVEGCYYNVVGLPVSVLWDLLKPSPSGDQHV